MENLTENVIGLELLSKLENSNIEIKNIKNLLVIHRTLWALEDKARSKMANDSEIANIKREIDKQNGKRHKQIDLIDSTLDYSFNESSTVVAHNETIGEIVDRILIMSLKIDSCRGMSTDLDIQAQKRNPLTAKLSHLESWNNHLLTCLSNLLDDIKQKKAILPPRVDSKFYNDPIFNPVTRNE